MLPVSPAAGHGVGLVCTGAAWVAVPRCCGLSLCQQQGYPVRTVLPSQPVPQFPLNKAAQATCSLSWGDATSWSSLSGHLPSGTFLGATVTLQHLLTSLLVSRGMCSWSFVLPGHKEHVPGLLPPLDQGNVPLIPCPLQTQRMLVVTEDAS